MAKETQRPSDSPSAPHRMVVRHGEGDITSIEPARDDDFVRYEERMHVWGWLSREFGAKWALMSTPQKEAAARKYTGLIVEEIKAMAGGLWEHLSPANKRELFHARFIDRNARPVPVRHPVPAPRRMTTTEPAKGARVERAATGFLQWVADNAGRLPADWGERRRLYLEERGISG